MLLGLFTRLSSSLRVLFGKRVLVIEITYDPQRKQDCVTLFGTETDPLSQLKILRTLAASIEDDLSKKS